jgi:c-di-GMP-binding flagellar brake protein YcgR
MTITRREHERFQVSLPTTVIVQGAELSATAHNLSLGGARLSVTGAVPFGASIKLRLRLPGVPEDSVIDATVRWVTGDMIGVQFGSLRAKEVRALNQLVKDLEG